MALQPVDPALSRVALFVVGLVELGRSAASGGGKTVWTAGSTGNMATVLHRIANEDDSVDNLPVSAVLRALLRRITARRPEDRPSLTEFLAALEATPEGEATEVPLTGG